VAKDNDEPTAEVEHSDTSGSEGSLVNEVEQVNQHSMQLHFSSPNKCRE
jgi:hypothetical protein